MRKRKFRVKLSKEDNTKETVLSKLLRKQMLLIVVAVFVVTLTLLGSSYAVFSDVKESANANIIKAGTLNIIFDETASGNSQIINLNGTYPKSDTDGQASSPYTFTIKNTGSIVSSYTIKIQDDTDMIEEDGCSNNLLPKDKIKYSINGETPVLLSSKETDSYIVETSSLFSNSSRQYSIRMWIDESAGNEVLNNHYHGKIIVESVQGEEYGNAVDMLIDKSNTSITSYIKEKTKNLFILIINLIK